MNKLSNKLTEILGIEGFRVGDVVKYKNIPFEILGDDGDSLYINNLAVCGERFWTNSKDLKLISRDFTLSEVLMAIFKVWKKREDEDYPEYLHNWYYFVLNYLENNEILEKWNIDKTLFQQEQSTIDSISKIMGG